MRRARSPAPPWPKNLYLCLTRLIVAMQTTIGYLAILLHVPETPPNTSLPSQEIHSHVASKTAPISSRIVSLSSPSICVEACWSYPAPRSRCRGSSAITNNVVWEMSTRAGRRKGSTLCDLYITHPAARFQ
ncbi:hypothetical protein P153DRAFT_147031 [Dothidotthia symphoricarpi CBS 119687]|uniref:Uncharacterized protein n=1 Tax=Dothidotthia symphoricarpi CBS 119687 TaxID=1392245 RepID=A0A6A5ZZG1_9PLEO|nr:uncharacterized protein P153DRAFT_147031 [Dothidotthia symphoricarpi CBS 119687]KAF2123818.1 hypothetical protein P153DRAFT_147031 [Dothidotthia symphoricarpi CBS 119687]